VAKAKLQLCIPTRMAGQPRPLGSIAHRCLSVGQRPVPVWGISLSGRGQIWGQMKAHLHHKILTIKCMLSGNTKVQLKFLGPVPCSADCIRATHSVPVPTSTCSSRRHVLSRIKLFIVYYANQRADSGFIFWLKRLVVYSNLSILLLSILCSRSLKKRLSIQYLERVLLCFHPQLTCHVSKGAKVQLLFNLQLFLERKLCFPFFSIVLK
jgi:hypothetical protein